EPVMPALLPPARARLHQPHQAGHPRDFAEALIPLAHHQLTWSRITRTWIKEIVNLNRGRMIAILLPSIDQVAGLGKMTFHRRAPLEETGFSVAVNLQTGAARRPLDGYAVGKQQ
ncbi:hypothetical protein, partial [Micromonospora gifhornensis]|uniref:hypothetical protein n=1 Tax=Micromonospora gifhornensis TaxID=84594 RepID=UPI0036533D5A